MTLYRAAADQLLMVVNQQVIGDSFTFLNIPGFTFEYRRDYSGLMAEINPKYKSLARSKQGLFDVRGTMNGAVLRHDQLFEELLNNSNLYNCFEIWKGNIPQCRSREEYNALISLAMLMFEQEINFGNEIFQRKSHFSQIQTDPNKRRPRDLLMGYLYYMFEQGNVDCLNQYKYQGQLHPPPKNSEIKTLYFDSLQNNKMAYALMTPCYHNYEHFRGIAKRSSDNPNL